MASLSEFESLDEEVKELLQHYKHKKATTYEPCTLNNIRECLIGLHEELDIFNISYTFNPFLDFEDDSLRAEALVKLINSMWTLLHHHKNHTEKSERLSEHNHILEQNNKQLKAIVTRLKERIESEKNEAKACVASAQRISDQSDMVSTSLTDTRRKLLQITKQKDSMQKGLKNEIDRLTQENEKLLDRLRNKSGSFTPCSEVCDTTLLQLKERERRQREIITKLQTNNQELIQEVLALKEEIVLSGLKEYALDCKK